MMGIRRLWRLVRVRMGRLDCCVAGRLAIESQRKTNDVPVCIAKPGRAVYAVEEVSPVTRRQLRRGIHHHLFFRIAASRIHHAQNHMRRITPSRGTMATKLDKSIKRELEHQGKLYTITLAPEGV